MGKDENAQEKEMERLKQQVAFYRKDNRKLRKERADVSNLVERMKESLSVIEPQGVWQPPKRWPRSQEEEELVALVSDCQIGTKSLGEEIGLTQPRVYGPLGNYNIQVFRYRLRIWIKAILKITRLMRSRIPIKKLNVFFLGDILENEWIFRGQSAYLETGLIQQYYMALQEWGAAIAILASRFETVQVRGVCGNHGRGTPKPGATKTWVNWEWLWYRYLELLCRDLPNVEFNLTMSWFDIADVCGFNWLLLHLEDAKRYMRYPWYSVGRMEKAYSEMLEAVGEHFTYMAFGHHHVASTMQTSKGEWLANGNWVGATQFSMKVLTEFAAPRQWLFSAHEKRGLASRWLIDLLIEDEKLWREVERTAPNIDIPPTNQEITAAMQDARWIKI